MNFNSANVFWVFLGNRLYARPRVGDEKVTKYGSILWKGFSVCEQNINSEKNTEDFIIRPSVVTIEVQSTMRKQGVNPDFHLKNQEKLSRKKMGFMFGLYKIDRTWTDRIWKALHVKHKSLAFIF